MEKWQQFLVTELGLEDVVLGLPWLRSMNPKINWGAGEMKVDSSSEEKSNARVEPVTVNRAQRRQWWKTKVLDDLSERLWCAARYTYSAELAEKAGVEKRKQTFEEIVPEEYRQYAKVFSEVESERLPEHKLYDHAIDLKLETPKTLQSKIYPM